MNIKWTKGLDKQQQIELKESYRAAKLIREKLLEILKEEEMASVKEMAKKSNFDKPAWSEFQAFKLGEQEAIRKVITLLEDK